MGLVQKFFCFFDTAFLMLNSGASTDVRYSHSENFLAMIIFTSHTYININSIPFYFISISYLWSKQLIAVDTIYSLTFLDIWFSIFQQILYVVYNKIALSMQPMNIAVLTFACDAGLNSPG
jgi:hypothetical protein